MANRLLNSTRFRNNEDGGKMALATALSQLNVRTRAEFQPHLPIGRKQRMTEDMDRFPSGEHHDDS
ncbi:hypothetical protein [Neorhizobium alkalisoli]|uniref:hypothetical protein n=1 Tax=Neorhizobium alkalisoli TaxID=528178 RepID=UPI00131A1B3C|nr:hypothetical protein [Neorhizobium alkalisoli]